MALIEKFKAIVHAFDLTPASIEWVKKQGFPSSFVLYEYDITDFDGNTSFYPPINPDHVSHIIPDRPETKNRGITVPVKRLSTIMRELRHDYIDVLKRDIEGAEFKVIEDIKKSNIKTKQILIELHHWFSNLDVGQTKRAYSELKKGDTACFPFQLMVRIFASLSNFLNWVLAVTPYSQMDLDI